MRKRRGILLITLLLFCTLPAAGVSAAKKDTLQISVQAKNNQQKKKSKKNPNAPGWHTKANGKKYYILKDGKKAVGWTNIKGKYYYFKGNGILNTKTGWVNIGGKICYICEDGSRYGPGFGSIGGKLYYFDKEGILVTNKRPCALGGQYYNIDSQGVAERISALEAQCEVEAQKFIAKHSKETMSNLEKLRSCFRYLLAYMRYRPKPPNWSEFKVNEWYYRKAISTFRSPTLDGNCYSFACTVAACAKELGYKPTVVVIKADHGFVMIDGKYYDNMKGGLFGSSVPSCPGYQVYTTAEF